MSDAAGIGHNQPPTDQEIFIAKLEETYAQLPTAYADLERERRKLPKEVTSQAHVDAITAFAVKCGRLAQDAERTRVMVKAPYLEREKWIDGWFNDIKALAKASMDQTTAKANAWLQGRRRAEEAARAAAAARAREEARAAEQAAQAARDAEEAARKARQGAEESLRKPAPAPEPAGENVVAFPAASEENRLRETYESEQAAQIAAEEAAKAARVAQHQAEQAEEHAIAPAPLPRASQAGGSIKVKESWSPRVLSLIVLRESLGPSGPHFTERELDVMLVRAARVDSPPAIPGVQWIAESSVKTTLSRARKGQANAVE
jgi:hypothetical protein